MLSNVEQKELLQHLPKKIWDDEVLKAEEIEKHLHDKFMREKAEAYMTKKELEVIVEAQKLEITNLEFHVRNLQDKLVVALERGNT